MTLYERPSEILQHLIRFDTTNPPGSEAPCIAWVDSLLKDAGLETTILGRTPERTNLISRLKGRGDAPPLLLYGHVDVVPTAGQNWTHPPFDGLIVDDYVWGRGAIDMKGADAMMIAAFLRAHAEGTSLPGDVILALVSDEEAGGDYGAKFLVENHAGLFAGARYALGEFGGFSMYLDRKRYYPIMLAERRIVTVQVIVRGAGGHGAMRHTGGAMTRLAHALLRLENRLPVRITPVIQAMLETIAQHADDPMKGMVLGMLDPTQTDAVLDLLGPQSRMFDPLLHNTANPTMIQGGTKVNVIPSEILLTLDGRVLPGTPTGDFLAELQGVIGDDFELRVLEDDQPSPAADMSLFEMLGGILREQDPEGIPLPYLVSGATDARYFSRIGIQTYGFIPMLLPEDFNFAATVHAADERIPVAALDFGAQAIFKAIQRFA